MSRYLRDSKAFFLHIPRTGGTWVFDTMNILGVHSKRWMTLPISLPKNHVLLSHMSPEGMKKVDYIFAFVRNPIAYYESVWKLISIGDRGNRFGDRFGTENLRPHWLWHPHMSVTRHYNPDFNRWVEAVLKHEPCWYTRLIESYVGPEGAEFCDFIGRTETLNEDLLNVLEGLGYEKQIAPHREEILKKGRVHNIDREMDWDPELKRRVEETERLVTARFYDGDNFHHKRYRERIRSWRQRTCGW